MTLLLLYDVRSSVFFAILLLSYYVCQQSVNHTRHANHLPDRHTRPDCATGKVYVVHQLSITGTSGNAVLSPLTLWAGEEG